MEVLRPKAALMLTFCRLLGISFLLEFRVCLFSSSVWPEANSANQLL